MAHIEGEEDMMESEVDWTQKQHDLFFSVCAGQMLLFLIILTNRLERSSGLSQRGHVKWSGVFSFTKRFKRL